MGDDIYEYIAQFPYLFLFEKCKYIRDAVDVGMGMGINYPHSRPSIIPVFIIVIAFTALPPSILSLLLLK